MIRRKNRLAARRGTAAVEAALVLPVTLLFLFGIIEYGRYVMTMQILNAAARAGARYALSHVQPIILNGVTYGNATSDVQNAVNTALTGQLLANQTVSVFESSSTGQNIGTWTSATSRAVNLRANNRKLYPDHQQVPLPADNDSGDRTVGDPSRK